MSSVETAGGRGERRGRRPARVAGDISQLPSKQPRNLMPPVDLVSADQLESIHEAALTILEEIGMDVLLPEARDILQAAGAKVDGLRVRADRELVLGAVANAPAEFTMHARNPAHDLQRRRQLDDVLAGGEPAQLLRPRRRPAPGQPGRFPQLPEARPDLQHPASDRRLHGRADRHPARRASPRGAARHLHDDRQAHPLLLAGLGPDPRRHRDVPHRARHRPRAARARAVPDDDHQHELAAAAGFADGRRHHRDGARRPDRRADPVHAGGCHGAGHGGRRGGAAERRGAARHRADAAGAAGCAGDLWRLHQQCRHEVRRPRLRHARIHEVGAGRRPACPPLQPALPQLEHLRRQLRRRPGDVRIDLLALGRGHGPGQPGQCTRPAGSRAACAPRSRSW